VVESEWVMCDRLRELGFVACFLDVEENQKSWSSEMAADRHGCRVLFVISGQTFDWAPKSSCS